MPTVNKSDRPHGYTDEIKQFLDDLRESGDVNMAGANRNLEQEFSLDRNLARTLHRYWMKTFGREEV